MPVDGVEEAGLLDHLASRLDNVDLALDLVFDRLLDEAEGVDVLQLGAGAEFLLAEGADRDVGVAAEGALLEVAVADAEIDDDLVQLLEVGDGLVGAAHVRLGDNLQQRRAGAVEVDQRAAGALGALAVEEFAGILLHVDAGDADALRSSGFRCDVEVAVLADRQFELGDLVPLGEVGIEVVLAGEDRARRDRAVGGQPGHDRVFDHLAVEDRQGSRQPQADRAGLGVGGVAEAGRAAAEDLAGGGQLDVDLQADDGFIVGSH